MEIKTSYTRIFKPVGDFILALIVLILMSPVLLLISLILLFHNHAVIFRHTRPGLNGKLFEVYKFTSIPGGDERVPFRFGKFLRRTSLDELPQLFNVLKGEMSFIGPRPLLIEYLDQYTTEQHKRHLVKPGITGWAQVNGRNTVSFGKKLALDVFYVQNLSFVLDIKILLMTVVQVLMWRESDYHDVVIVKSKEISKVG